MSGDNYVRLCYGARRLLSAPPGRRYHGAVRPDLFMARGSGFFGQIWLCIGALHEFFQAGFDRRPRE